MSDTVLVIGGGIAGIQAALDLANAGARVILVEREPTIGGIMAVLDKNFPTLDCSHTCATEHTYGKNEFVIRTKRITISRDILI